MNKKILIIMLLFSLISIFFVYHDDFLYKDPIMKIEKIDRISAEKLENPLGFKEKHYTLKITGVITNTKDKGRKKTLEHEETSSSVVTDKLKKGDKLIISGSDITLKRDFYIAIMIVLFINLLYITGLSKGLLSILSLVLNLIIFYIGLSLYFKGVNLLFLCVIEMILFSCLSLIITSGFNKMTISAIISSIISIIVMLVIMLIVVYTTKYKGINFNEIAFLTVPLEDVVLPELLLGGVGAIMDVAITISSSIRELIEKDPSISKENLFKSSKEIGKDIMSTMSNVLFFTYLCAGLPIFALALRNGFSMYNYISTNFTLELTRFLTGSIGIILTIPVAARVSVKLMKRGKVNE